MTQTHTHWPFILISDTASLNCLFSSFSCRVKVETWRAERTSCKRLSISLSIHQSIILSTNRLAVWQRSATTHQVRLQCQIWTAAPSFWHPGHSAELHEHICNNIKHLNALKMGQSEECDVLILVKRINFKDKSSFQINPIVLDWQIKEASLPLNELKGETTNTSHPLCMIQNPIKKVFRQKH